MLNYQRVEQVKCGDNKKHQAYIRRIITSTSGSFAYQKHECTLQHPASNQTCSRTFACITRVNVNRKGMLQKNDFKAGQVFWEILRVGKLSVKCIQVRHLKHSKSQTVEVGSVAWATSIYGKASHLARCTRPKWNIEICGGTASFEHDKKYSEILKYLVGSKGKK